MRVERVRDPASDADIDSIVSLEVESFTNPWSLSAPASSASWSIADERKNPVS